MPNPLLNFLAQAKATMSIYADDSTYGSTDRSRYAAFTENSEKRNYSQDLVRRVEMLAYCYDRLCELSPLYHEIHEAMLENQPSPHSIDRSRVRPEVKERERRWNMETETLTALACYELKSVSDMLKQWQVSVPTGSEVDYLLKVRDRFLAHPQFRGVMRKAHRSVAIPFDAGMTRRSVVGFDVSDTITQAHYLSQSGVRGSWDRATELGRNRSLILSHTSRRFTPQEAARLKAFGLPEPNLEVSLEETADLLQREVLPLIAACFAEAVREFNFGRARVVFD